MDIVENKLIIEINPEFHEVKFNYTLTKDKVKFDNVIISNVHNNLTKEELNDIINRRLKKVTG